MLLPGTARRSVSFPGMRSFLPDGMVQSSPRQSTRTVKKCMSLFKGRAIAECAPVSRLLSLWTTKVGQLDFLLHSLDPFYNPTPIKLSVLFLCHGVSLILVLFLVSFLQL